MKKKHEDLIKELVVANIILKNILEKAIKKGYLCYVCEEMGQNLIKCKCKNNKDCLKHMVNLSLKKDYMNRKK